MTILKPADHGFVAVVFDVHAGTYTVLASGFSNEPEYDSAGQLPLHYATRHRAKVAKALSSVRSGLRVNSKTSRFFNWT